ncbi:MAG: hypothetical protein V7K47_01925 [Nostoc sp.]
MWFDSLPYGTLLLACLKAGVRLRYLGFARYKSRQVVYQPGDEGE